MPIEWTEVEGRASVANAARVASGASSGGRVVRRIRRRWRSRNHAVPRTGGPVVIFRPRGRWACRPTGCHQTGDERHVRACRATAGACPVRVETGRLVDVGQCGGLGAGGA